MRKRGLGSSAIRLRDSNADGAMDTVVRHDFNSSDPDVVILTDAGKVRGGYLKKQQELTAPIRYTVLEDVPEAQKPTGKVYLLGHAAPRARIKEGRGSIDLTITDGPNFTGTRILSERLMRLPIRGEPIMTDFYGTTIEVVGLNAKNRLEYRRLNRPEEQLIPFVFRGLHAGNSFRPSIRCSGDGWRVVARGLPSEQQNSAR